MRFLQTTNYKLQTRRAASRRGYTLIEILIVLGIIAIFGAVALVNLVGRRGGAELLATAERIAALLREAQSRSVSQASSTSWGVHFENGSTPFYALYAGAYGVSAREAYYALPETMDFAAASIPEGGFLEISFTQLSGAASSSSTINIFSLRNPAASATVTVATSGAVSY